MTAMNTTLIQRCLIVAIALSLIACTIPFISSQKTLEQDKLIGQTEINDWPSLNSQIAFDDKVEKQVQALLDNMTLAEKVGQMIQAEIKSISPSQVRDYHIGSILNGGGSFPQRDKYASIDDWLRLADAYFIASTDTSDGHNAIPLLWGTDAVHGHNNVIGATYFPHNIGLGATQNPELIEVISRITAKEVAATGI